MRTRPIKFLCKTCAQVTMEARKDQIPWDQPVILSSRCEC